MDITLGEVYSKAKPHMARILAAAMKAGLPEELIRHQFIAEVDAMDPEILEGMAMRMNQLVNRYYLLKLKVPAMTWRDVYGVAAAAFKEGTKKIDAIILETGPQWENVSTRLPNDLVQYVSGPRRSVFWDFKDESGWGWFNEYFKPSSGGLGTYGPWAALIAVAALYALYRYQKDDD